MHKDGGDPPGKARANPDRTAVESLASRPDKGSRMTPPGTRARALWTTAVVAAAVLAHGGAPAEAVRAPHIEVELIAESGRAQPRATVPVAVRMAMEHGWHVYWRNPGDSGLPPTIRWALPAGWTAGPIAWPVPERLRTGPLVDYGYEGEVLFPVRLEAAPDALPGTRA